VDYDWGLIFFITHRFHFPLCLLILRQDAPKKKIKKKIAGMELADNISAAHIGVHGARR
jgi:hypothetical protein